MHRSGIQTNEKLQEEFRTAQDEEDVLYIQIKIQDEVFVKTSQGKKVGDLAANFEAVQKALKPKDPCYMLMKVNETKWLLIYYVPDNSVVKQKMLIASSFADLKTGLGDTHFVGEYPISETEECTAAEWKKATSDVIDDSLLTWQERDAKNSAYDSTMSMSETKVNAVVGLPIGVTESSKKAIADFKEGNCNTVVFILDAEKEELNAETDTSDLEAIVGKLPEREPRYVLHMYDHERDGAGKKKAIFVYYCPDKSKPRLRMFYSTAKSNVLGTIDNAGIEEPKRIEISLTSELTAQAVMEEIYPKSSVKKVFKKPTRQGKGRAKFHGSKFSAAPR